MKLKGETTIELTDVKTGQVTTFKDENFLTNALSDICQPITRKQDTLNTVRFAHEGTCSTEALMRGLLLFDSTLPNDASKYFPETGVKMIGHASNITYAGADLTFGSYNTNQSSIGADTEKTYVWDFTAEQANGTINAVCLTTQAGGYIGYGSEDLFDDVSNAMSFTNMMKAGYFNDGASQVARDRRVPLYLSFEGDYLIELDYTTLATNTLTFHKTKLSTNEIDIFKKFQEITTFEDTDKHYSYIGGNFTDTSTIEVDITTLGSGAYFGMALDGKNLYITQKQSVGEGSSTNAWQTNVGITVLKIDLETFEVSTYTVVNTTGVPLGIRASYDRMSSGGFTFGVSNGYLFARSWESTLGNNVCKLYAINIRDNTDVKQIVGKNGETKFVGLEGLSTSTPFAMSVQGNVVFSSVNMSANAISTMALMHCVDTITFKLKAYCTTLSSFRSQGALTISSISRPLSCDNPLYHVVENRASSNTGNVRLYISVVPNVLMTINNLTNPVEKTPAQTMRIIYKISKAE